MPLKVPKSVKITTALVATIIAISAISAFLYLEIKGNENPTQLVLQRKLSRERDVYSKLDLSLVDPAQAPPQIRNLVEEGYQIIIDTQKNAKAYVGDRLNCTNCHFAGGNTTGGVQGGISLVGTAAKYPTFDRSMKRVINLEERINNCFRKSMNGKKVPVEDPIMLALVTYLHWIAKDLPIYGEMPWLGLNMLSTTYQGSPSEGKKIYNIRCSLCHHEDGQGDKNAPPLWGKGSFNRKAGFNNPDLLSAFIYWNMPYFENTPILSEQEAKDVASYILSHSR